MKKLIGLLPFIILAACATTDTPAPEPAPKPVVQAPAPPPVFKPVQTDSCGAYALQDLVGKPRSEIPVPLEPSRRRVLCSTCAATMDFNAQRQTIVFDTDTGIVKSVSCG
ncbi:MAG: proteinase inhibitor i78 [Asticcacaulis sp.]